MPNSLVDGSAQTTAVVLDALSPSRAPSAAREHRAPFIHSRLVGAIGWVVLGTMAAHVLRLGGNLIVSHMLSPDMFGVVSIAMVVQVMMALLSDVGLIENIIRRPHGGDLLFLNTAWTVQVLRGFLMWGGCLVVATTLHFATVRQLIPPDSAYAAPMLPWILAVNSFSCVLHGFHSTKVATENRNLRLVPLIKLDLLAQIICLTVMIVTAKATGSIWSLVVGSLISQLAYTVLSHRWLDGYSNRFCWNREALKELISFGKWLFWSSLFAVFAMNADRLLLGAMVNAHLLGLYSISISLVGAVDMLVGQVFSKALMPVFSEVARSHPEQVPAAYLSLRRRVDPAMLFVSGALCATGQLIVDILYDARYREAGQILEVLALSMIATRFSLVQQVYLALNRPHYQVVLNLVRFISIYALVPLMYFLFGLKGALFAIALRELATLPFIFRFNARHGMNNFRLELALLATWPVGWIFGEGLKWFAASLLIA